VSGANRERAALASVVFAVLFAQVLVYPGAADLVAGLSNDDAEAVYGDVRLRDGAGDLIRSLRDAGVTVVVLTGGFAPGVEAALEAAGTSADSVVANHLPTDDDGLTGEVEGPLVEGTKDDALWEACGEFDVAPENAVAVGDGANDVPMLEEAGFAVGFQPKSGVDDHCDVSVASVQELEELFEDRGLLA